MRRNSTPHIERVYVKVNSDFDSTGYMQPKSITWADGGHLPLMRYGTSGLPALQTTIFPATVSPF